MTELRFDGRLHDDDEPAMFELASDRDTERDKMFCAFGAPQRRTSKDGNNRVMKTMLSCPCGAALQGLDEDDLVDKVRSHLATEHPGRAEYSREEILFLAY